MSPLYLIDGYNFLHAVVLKGRDRAHWWSVENQRAVQDWVAGRPLIDARTCIVFDQRSAGAPGGVPAADAADPEASAASAAVTDAEPQVCFAPDADAFILARCAALEGTCTVVVVSADRSLVDRAKQRGARSLSPWKFARYAEEGAPSGHEPPSPRG